MLTRSASAGRETRSRGRTSSIVGAPFATVSQTRRSRSETNVRRPERKSRDAPVIDERKSRSRTKSRVATKETRGRAAAAINTAPEPRRSSSSRRRSTKKSAADSVRSLSTSQESKKRPSSATKVGKVDDQAARTSAVKASRPVGVKEEALKKKVETLKRKLKDLEVDAANSRKKSRLAEAQLRKQEREFGLKEKTLHDRELALRRKEEELESLRVRQGTEDVDLQRLEDVFTCALCFDVMACPYSLVPARCGHSFCALCLLKWFFSHLHRACGMWHVDLECPLCRAQLPRTGDETPRSIKSCPFSPNRLADMMLKGLIDSIAAAPHIESVGGSGSKGKKKKFVDATDVGAAAWRQGGTLRKEWEERGQ